MRTKMLIILEYERGSLMQRDILDGILESGAGRLSLYYYASISPPYDKHSKPFRDTESFCRWLLRECVIRHDSPFYLDEYLHAMVDEWHNTSE